MTKLTNEEIAFLSMAVDDDGVVVPPRLKSHLLADLAIAMQSLEQYDRANAYLDRSLSLCSTAANHSIKAGFLLANEQDWPALGHGLIALLHSPFSIRQWRLLKDIAFVIAATGLANTIKALSI